MKGGYSGRRCVERVGRVFVVFDERAYCWVLYRTTRSGGARQEDGFLKGFVGDAFVGIHFKSVGVEGFVQG